MTEELTSTFINGQCAVRCHSTMNNSDIFTWLLILKHALERSGKVESVGGFYEKLYILTGTHTYTHTKTSKQSTAVNSP